MNVLIRLALRNIQKKKTKTIFLFSSIMIASFLLMVIGMATKGIIHLNNENVHNSNINYHIKYSKVSKSTIKQMANDDDIKALLISKNIGTIEKNKMNVYMVYNEDLIEGIHGYTYEEGQKPQKENEIAGSKALFEALNVASSIGSEITIPIRINGQGKIINKKLTICGIIKNNRSEDKNLNININKYTYSIMVSNEFVKKYATQLDGFYNIFIRLDVNNNISYNQIEHDIDTLTEKYEIPSDNVKKNTAYLKSMNKSGTETLMLAISIAFIIILFSSLVVYSIYSAILMLDVQTIGRYRVIGADYKQVKTILYFENTILTFIGLFTGMVFGYIVAYCGLKYLYSHFPSVALPNLITFKFILFLILIVFISTFLCFRPAIKKALSISPIKAVKYQIDDSFLKSNRLSYKTIDINKLVKIDLKRNRKNVKVAIVTMSLSCALFIASSALLSSIDLEAFVKETISEGQFIVQLNYSYNDKEYPENNLNMLQESKILNDMKSDLLLVDGIKRTQELYLALGDIIYPNTLFDGKRVTIGTFDEEDVSQLEKSLERGTLDYNSLVKQSGIVYTYGHAFEKNGFAINDEFEIQFLVGDQVVSVPVKLMASTSSLGKGTFLIPIHLMRDIYGDDMPVYAIAVHSEPACYDSVKGSLMHLSDDEHYILYSEDEEKAYGKQILSTIQYPIILVCTFIGMIGFITILNTMVISIIRRRKEIAVYQCLGLSKKQLFSLLYKEMLVLIGSSFGISLIFGNLLGYVLVKYAKANDWIAINSYRVPMKEMILLGVALCIVKLLLTMCMTKHLCNNNAIGNLRKVE